MIRDATSYSLSLPYNNSDHHDAGFDMYPVIYSFPSQKFE